MNEIPLAVFIGPMASGKSRLGKRVAKLLDAPYIDTDKEIVAKFGPIPEIFAQSGEAGFRQLEREVVAQALRSKAIVSLGGGAVLNEETQQQLSSLPVVYLHVSPESVATRLKVETRPLLSEGLDGWKRIFEERRSLYEELASIDVDTSHAHLGELAEQVAAWIRDREAAA